MTLYCIKLIFSGDGENMGWNPFCCKGEDCGGSKESIIALSNNKSKLENIINDIENHSLYKYISINDPDYFFITDGCCGDLEIEIKSEILNNKLKLNISYDDDGHDENEINIIKKLFTQIENIRYNNDSQNYKMTKTYCGNNEFYNIILDTIFKDINKKYNSSIYSCYEYCCGTTLVEVELSSFSGDFII
jgi:hypothetical protein